MMYVNAYDRFAANHWEEGIALVSSAWKAPRKLVRADPDRGRVLLAGNCRAYNWVRTLPIDAKPEIFKCPHCGKTP